MGSVLTLLILGSLAAGGPIRPAADTTTYADAATRSLVALGASRHRGQDSTVQAYEATIRYRLSFALGKRAWADLPNVAVEEQEGRVSWQQPNDLRVDMLGRRSASRLDDLQLNATFSRPLFAPRALGDSIRIFGLRTPVQAAPHPLSAGGPAHYRYAAGESITVSVAGRPITVRAVTVTPKGLGRSYVAGKLWLDIVTGDVVRFTFRFVGTGLWERPDGATAHDSADAGRTNQFINRILQIDADLEYGLQQQKYWMPYRQVISGRVTVPFGVELAVPFEGSTTFSDYHINAGTSVAFTVPFPAGRRGGGGQAIPLNGGGRGRQQILADSLRGRDRVGVMPGGGRYQIHVPPADSLRNYVGWRDSLVLETSEADRNRTRRATADLAAIIEELPGSMTGRPGAGFGLEKIPEMFRYNRVQGTVLSLAGRVPLPIAFTESFATVRYGFADERVMASLSVRRDAPSARWTVTGARDLVDLDPFARGLTFGNSLRAVFTGHDDGAYLLGQGVRASYETSLGLGRELTVTAFVEDQRGVVTAAGAKIPRLFGGEGVFGPNPGIREGLAAGSILRLEHGLFGTRWRADAQAMTVDGQGAARLAADLSVPELTGSAFSLRLLGGLATGVDAVPQLALNAGGIGSVRGFDFGTQRGAALWAAQLALTPGRGGIRPVLFIDAGQAATLRQVRDTPVLVGAGAGLSFFGGLLRAERSHPLTPRNGRGARFDLIVGGVP